MAKIRISQEVDTQYGVAEITLERKEPAISSVMELTIKRLATDQRDEDEEVTLQVTDNQVDEIISTLQDLKGKSKR